MPKEEIDLENNQKLIKKYKENKSEFILKKKSEKIHIHGIVTENKNNKEVVITALSTNENYPEKHPFRHKNKISQPVSDDSDKLIKSNGILLNNSELNDQFIFPLAKNGTPFEVMTNIASGGLKLSNNKSILFNDFLKNDWVVGVAINKNYLIFKFIDGIYKYELDEFLKIFMPNANSKLRRTFKQKIKKEKNKLNIN